MPRIVVFCCLMLMSSIVFANQRIAVNVDVKLQRPGRHQIYQLHHVVNTTTNNHQWDILKDRNKKKIQVVLLTKIIRANSREIALKFLVVDNYKHLKILSSPKMIVAYGQKGVINVKEGDHRMQLAVRVIPV